MVVDMTLRCARAAVVLALVAAAAGGAAAHASGNASVRPSIAALIADSLRADHDRSSPRDGMYYTRGRWRSDDEGHWPANTGPATAAAILYRDSRARWFADVSVATIDRAIARYARPDGSFDGTSARDIATMEFASQIGRSYLALGEALPRGTRARWRNALRGAADFLIRNGNLAWYTNGNIALGNAEVMALAHRVTRDARFDRAYRLAFSFAVAPPQPRWAGYGLRVTRTPTRADGADGAAYLGEASEGSPPGFDPEYTQLQLDIASRLFLLVRDTRTLRLTNELANVLLPRVDRTSWLLDTSDGTRHPAPGRRVPFTTPALSVLAWQGGRADLARVVGSQLRVVDQQYRSALTFSHRNYYRGLGDQLATILQATYSRAHSCRCAAVADKIRPRP
jgi:hypothetical protein